MTNVILVLALVLLFPIHARAETPDERGSLPPTIYRGIVIKQIHGCEVDGTCSVEVKTDGTAGVVDFIWAPPDGGCRVPSDIAATASKLMPGDHVEIWTHSGTTTLCGDEARIVLTH
jgi:hypothetical protein